MPLGGGAGRAVAPPGPSAPAGRTRAPSPAPERESALGTLLPEQPSGDRSDTCPVPAYDG